MLGPRMTQRLFSKSFFVCNDLSLNSNITNPLQRHTRHTERTAEAVHFLFLIILKMIENVYFFPTQVQIRSNLLPKTSIKVYDWSIPLEKVSLDTIKNKIAF